MKKLIDVEPFAVAFLKTKGSREYRVASAIYAYAEHTELMLPPDAFYAGNTFFNNRSAIYYHSSGGITYDFAHAKTTYKKYPLLSVPLFFVRHAMMPSTTEMIVACKTSWKNRLRRVHKNLWGTGGGHGNPDYKLLLESGTDGLRKKIAAYRAVNIGKEDFYDSLSLTLDAFDLLADRYRALAEKLLPTAPNKTDLIRMIAALKRVPRSSPTDFYEACQFFWLAFSFLETDSPGLFDYALGKYYEEDKSGEKYLCLQKLWELFHTTRSWNLCVGGSDEYGNDLTCELTYDVLKVAREYKYNTPNITMRFHKNSPEKAWQAAVDTLATGIGMPAVYNDECVCPALERLGIPPRHSHLYCMNGCNQIDIFGKSHMGLEDGEINVAKPLEYIFFHGVCQSSHVKLGLDVGDLDRLDTFGKFMDAFKKEIVYMADTVTDISVRAQKLYAKYGVNPWRSNLIEGCIEKGLDYKNRGPLYGHGQILTEGLPDAVDSLAAVKHFVYDEKKYTLRQVKDALRHDYKGYEQMHRDFSDYDKFGNDVEEVDAIYKEVTDFVYSLFLKYDTFRGGKFGVGCSTFSRAADYARHTGALPNGKKKKDVLFSDSIGAVPGKDTHGPTALLNSVLHADQTLATSGNVLQMKFSKSQFNTPAGKEAFVNLAKTYFALGGQTLQINVLSKEELIDAQLHPENHRDLVVRVGGFSAYFVDLEKGLQENIIQRTEQPS